MVDFVTGLQAVSAGLNALKDLNAVEQEFDKASLKLKIAELSSSLVTAQLTLAEAQTEASKKDNEIAKLRENFKQKAEMVEYDGFMYRKSQNGKPLGRVYCPRCLDNGSLMMTTEWKHGTRCPECKNEYFQMIFGFKDE